MDASNLESMMKSMDGKMPDLQESRHCESGAEHDDFLGRLNPFCVLRGLHDPFRAFAPAGVTVKVTPHHGGEPAVTPIDSLGYQAASKAYEKTFGKKPIVVNSNNTLAKRRKTCREVDVFFIITFAWTCGKTTQTQVHVVCL